MKTPKRKRKLYVTPEVFNLAINAYYNSNLTDETAAAEIGNYIKEIASGMAQRKNFSEYTYLDEMVNDAMLKMWCAVREKKYNPHLGFNPFSYFSRITQYVFINRIKVEKRIHETRHSYAEYIYDDSFDTIESDNQVYHKRSKNFISDLWDESKE